MAVHRLLGRGCDPVRAKFAKENWEPVLGCVIDIATDDETLWDLVSKRKYTVFFLAPGYHSICGNDPVYYNQLLKKMRELQPGIKIIEINNVSQGLPLLCDAVGMNQPSQVIRPQSVDWPFVD